MKEVKEKMKNDVFDLTQETDVVIVGYGPVGAALAVYLGKLGVSTIVIEKNLEILKMPRAIALDNEALRVLQRIGLADDSFDKIPIEIVRMHCPFLGQFSEINTSGKIDEMSKLVTFYQPDLENALRKQVSKYSHIHILHGAEFLSFTENQNSIDISIKDAQGCDRSIHAKYLVGADGASSKIRSLIGFDFCGASYSEDWLIVDAKNRHGKAIDHIEFICNPERPTPHMPAPGGRERWEFMLQPHETREEMEKPEKIQELLKAWGNLEDFEIERQAVYRFHARCCDQFQKGKVFLVGDAAHITPPFVGQGLVAGLRDIANLGWKLKFALKTKHPIHLLESYDKERRPHAKQMIKLAKVMGLMVMPQNKIKAIAIHGLMKTLGLIPFTRQYFTELKIKPQIRYKSGFLGSKSKLSGIHKSHFEIGKQISQIKLKNVDLQILKSDHCWQDDFVILGIGAEPKTFISHELLRKWDSIGGKISSIWSENNFKNQDGFIDIEKQWAIKSAKPFGLILRPDGIVYDIFDMKNINQSLSQCLGHLA